MGIWGVRGSYGNLGGGGELMGIGGGGEGEEELMGIGGGEREELMGICGEGEKNG